MKSRAIDNKRKELDNQCDLISDELQDIFKILHKDEIRPPYNESSPIIQKMRSLELQLDNIDKEVDRLKKEVWIAYENEREEVANIMQGLVDNAVEVSEDGLIKHYITEPKEFYEVVFKDYYMVSFSDYHKLLANKYHYHVTFNDLEGAYEYHKSFYTNEPLDKLLEYCKNIMGFSYIIDCTVKDMSEIKEYEIQNVTLNNGDTISDLFYKYKEENTGNEVVYNNKNNEVHSAHYSNKDTFISYQAYFVAIGNYQYIYKDESIQQFIFTLVNSLIFKSDTSEINKLKKNLDKMLNKKYFARFDEVNQLLKDYYHI